MNIHVGIDMVEIDRFKHFHTYPIKQLSRVFSSDEIKHCLESTTKSAERFAARFAFKEALFKALSHQKGAQPCALFTLFKHASLSKGRVPVTSIDWQQLGTTQQIAISSFTHTQTTACAVVILYTP